MMRKLYKWIWILTGALCSCQPIQRDVEQPIITYTPPSNTLNDLPSPFLPLTVEEKEQDWAKELEIANIFAREIDLYRAITCYRRALILLPPEAIERRLQITYDLILSYYLGHKYQEAINIFEASELVTATPLFPAFNQLLLILYDSYQQLGQTDKVEVLERTISKCSPETGLDLRLFSAFKKAEFSTIEQELQEHRNADQMRADLDFYHQYAKSPHKARALNAILPGAGYYYIGQRKTAVTAFLINTLFTAAAYQFFHRGYIAAGLITTSLEMGWYVGGINGAGLEAQEFNTRLYEGVAKKTMVENQLFPILMFETSF